MVSSATNQSSSFESIPAGEREKIVRRLAATGMSDTDIADIFGVGHYKIYQIRHAYNIPSGYSIKGQFVREYDAPAIVVETDVMAERFAKAMNGQRFTDIKTKSFGRMGLPPQTDVIAQSNIARCG